MRVWGLIVIVVSSLLALVISGFNPIKRTVEPDVPLDEFTSQLDQRIPALMKLYRIPGSSIALVRDSKIVWLKAYGYADVENGLKLTPDTPMRVQSISKSVTAWGIMKLAEQGKIDLDAPVASYLESWQFPSSDYSPEHVTIRQLLSHTSGLPLGDVFTIYSPKDAMPSLKEKLTQEAVLTRESGTAFSYSNTGYNLLELLIEEVTGQDFADFMKQQILIPLGMNRSSFDWNEDFNPAVPVGYDLRGQPVPVYVYPEKASGGLFATAEDIATFTIAGMSGISDTHKILSPAGINELYKPEINKIGIYGLVFDAYCLGHYTETLPGNRQAVSHGGQGSGIMTHFHSVPETGDAIVILTNSQRSWPFIAYLLSDWAQWRGFSSVGMGRLILGQYGLWIVICLIWSMILLQLFRVVPWIAKRNRPTILNSERSHKRYLMQAGLAAAIILGLVWCLSQKYLFITSVFPRSSQWLGISAFVWSVALLLSALVYLRYHSVRKGVVLMPKKHKISDFWNMGTAIGFSAALGIVLGAVLNNVVLWLCIGAGFGVVIGAITQKYKNKV